MKIIVVGLNHKSASIDIREKLAFDESQTICALQQLKTDFPEAEFLLLSTCNRVELYCAHPEAGGPDEEDIVNFMAKFHAFEPEKFENNLYVLKDNEAVRHLLTVTSSLDSMVLGEAQIIGQVKDSYRLACAQNGTGKVLNHLFHCAFSVGKKIHSTTSISTGRVSIPGVAVDLAKKLFTDISSAKVVVIGAGEMGQLLVQHLQHEGCKDIAIVNRTFDNAESMAQKYGITAQQWDALNDLLIEADIAISSAAGHEYLFSKNSIKEIMRSRKTRPLLIIDIAVPRNFEPSVDEIEGAHLYSVDDLAAVVQENRNTREDDIDKSIEIINESVGDFMDWLHSRDIGPLIGRMKEQFEQISRGELDRFFVGIRQEASCRDVLEPMVNRIVNKLLHCVIKNVNVVAREQGASEAARLVDRIVRHAEEIKACNGEKEQKKS